MYSTTDGHNRLDIILDIMYYEYGSNGIVNINIYATSMNGDA